MAIQFVVEDGTGLSTSTSYAEIAEFKQYFENKGTSFTQADAVIEAWLNEAAEYADNTYKWSGYKLLSTQALKIPRSDWYDCDNEDISESVPTALKKGIYELAYARQGASSIKTGSVTDNTVSSKSIGPVSVSYRSGLSGNGIVSYPNAEKWFSCLGQISPGRVCRV